MDAERFAAPPTTPPNYSRYDMSRTTTAKRDSLAAELERDPQLSAAKRQQRSHAFTSNMAHASLERQLMAAQTSRMELETKLREKDMLVDRLERDRRWFSDREREEREEKEKDRAQHEEEKRKTDNELRSLRASLAALSEEHDNLTDLHAALSRSTSQTIASQKSELSTLTRQVPLLEEELAQIKGIAEDRSRTIQKLQEQLDELGSAQDSITRKGVEEEHMAVVREELHRQANYLRGLEATNIKQNAELTILRDHNASIEVLKEEKRGLERKIKPLEELRAKVVRLEAQVEAGRREREEWAAKTVEANTPSTTPISITQSLSLLRLAHARLLEEHGAHVALLRRREAEIADVERREAEARTIVGGMEAEMRALNEKVSRQEHQAHLAEREVKFLQALVASFMAEDATRSVGIVENAKIQRVEELETLLNEYKSTNLQLVQELDAIGGDSSSLGRGRTRKDLADEIEVERVAKFEAQTALQAAEAMFEKHLEKIEELEQTLHELSGEIGAGRHVPHGVRVLSLKDNPEQQWVNLRQAVMDRLKSENEALMKRLKELEECGMVGGNLDVQHREELVPRESWELVNKEKNELEDVVKQKEKRLLRLQQVFTSKSAEFREAIASILGLKLAFYPNGQVRVTSMYDLTASFVFQPASKAGGAGAKMQLVAQGEGGPQDLPQLMRYWIEEEECIPGFMASVTIECYDKSKREGEASVKRS